MPSLSDYINDILDRIGQLRARVDRYGRPLALLLLLLLSGYGVALFFLGEYSDIASGWRRHFLSLGLAVVLSACNIALDWGIWITLCRGFGVAVGDRWGLLVFLSSFAANLVPMRAGRLLRPDGIGRLGRGRRVVGVQVEGVCLFFEGAGALAIIAFVVAWHWLPWLAPFVGLGVAAILFTVASRIARLATGTPLEVSPAFWWSWRTWTLFGLSVAGWLLDGLIFYLLMRDFPGALTWIQSVGVSSAAVVAGSGSGIPGGVGVVEVLLGFSLSLNDMPQAALAFSVAAYRLANFWCWIPVGWIALTMLNRKIARDEAS